MRSAREHDLLQVVPRGESSPLLASLAGGTAGHARGILTLRAPDWITASARNNFLVWRSHGKVPLVRMPDASWRENTREMGCDNSWKGMPNFSSQDPADVGT